MPVTVESVSESLCGVNRVDRVPSHHHPDRRFDEPDRAERHPQQRHFIRLGLGLFEPDRLKRNRDVGAHRESVAENIPQPLELPVAQILPVHFLETVERDRCRGPRVRRREVMLNLGTRCHRVPLRHAGRQIHHQWPVNNFVGE